MRLGPPVALEQVLGGERPTVDRVVVAVVALPELQRIEVELGRELVHQALEAEGALDVAGRAERLHRRRVEPRAALEDADVLAGVEHLHGTAGRGEPAVPACRVDELALERRQRPVRAGSGTQTLDRRVAVPGVEVLLAPVERALDRTSRLPGEIGGDVGVVPRPVLRAESAAHEAAHDADVIRRQPVVLGDALADLPDGLCRDVDREPVARLPIADGLVGLHRVVEDGLRAVLRFDDDVGLCEASLDVPSLLAALRDELAATNRFIRIEQRLERLPLHLDAVDGRSGLRQGVGRDGSDRLSVIVRFVGQRPQHAADAGSATRAIEVQLPHTRARVRAAEHGGMQHPGELDVGGVARVAGRSQAPVDPLRRPADLVQRSRGPLVERVLLDEDPLLRVAAFDLLFGPDQPCHDRLLGSGPGAWPLDTA